MAVSSYVLPTGEKLWKASACVRSLKKSSIRIQKARFALKSKWEADREETKLIRECERAVLLQEDQGSYWGVVVESWEKHLTKEKSDSLNETTRTDYVNCLKKHTNSWWKRQAAEITRVDVLEALNQLKAHSKSVSYQNKMKAIINGIFVYGIDNRLISGLDRSPAYGISLGRDEEKKPEILSLVEIRKLLHEAKETNHPWFPIWSMALLTGMRSGELYALKWSDVDFEKRVISVNKSYNPRRKIIKGTKADYWRYVPISDELKSLLEEIKSQAGDRAQVLPQFSQWRVGLQAKILRAFCSGIGLPSIKFHTLRACFSTQLISNSVAPAVVMKICGWKDLETMQRYIRLAGIEVHGATNMLQVLPTERVMAKAGNLFTASA
jgi:integrase